MQAHRLLLCLPARRSGVALAVALGVAAASAQADDNNAKPAATAAGAPVLSSPVPAGVVAGTGAGHHSPSSPIAPLPQRNDVVPWSVLTDLTRKTTKDGILPVFNEAQKGMDLSLIHI